ncbi:uncharacterized protein LOC108956903 [Eucalyptus grandis]|uniref:uncharacterized protein LOC108956903 n=1 Tax=Eucalyptus grandis TaxID=71139 RepID=UPI00192F05ED|nr:uncharacterized protein LOC108956903 [Eucalyptus grandis]
MEPSYPSGGGRQPPLPSPPKKELPLQGPRPSPLRVAKQSHAVQKPPRPHQLPHPAASSSWAPRPTQLPAGAAAVGGGGGPAEAHDHLRHLAEGHPRRGAELHVHRPAAHGSSSTSSGYVSPAARVAAIERTSPTGREKGFAAAAAEMGGPSAVAGDDELMCMLGDVQLAQSQGILTPAAPPAISAGFFSPATEPHMLQDLSPFWPRNHSYNSPSASTLFMGGPSAVAGDDGLMILTPAAPPAISADFFSPATEPHMLQDLSSFWPRNHSYNSPSASTLFMGGPSAVAGDDGLMILTPAVPPATEPHMLQDLSPFWPPNNSYSPSASTLFTAFSPSPTASSMENMKDEAGQRTVDMRASDRNYAIAAVQNLVGIDDRAKQITDLLEMEEVEETTQSSGGMQFLQNKLIRDILERNHEDPSFDETIKDFVDIFCEMKVLIVVDAVEKPSDLHAIVGDQLHWFGPGSRVIVTSQNEEILEGYDSDKAPTYKVSELDDGQAFELFCKHAFRMQSSMPDYDGLSNCIVDATKKLPLAVEVIGSFLRGKSIQEWEKMEKAMKARLMSSQKTMVGLQELLDICYGELDHRQKIYIWTLHVLSLVWMPELLHICGPIVTFHLLVAF